MTLPELFSTYPLLKIVISTKDKDGSVIHYRDPRDVNATLHSRIAGNTDLEIENHTGAGDAFLGTFLRYHIGLGYDVRHAHTIASQNAERQLTRKGATDETIMRSGKLPAYDSSFGRYVLESAA